VETSHPAEKKRWRSRHRSEHEVTFISYPKLLFVWPVILCGLVLWPFTAPAKVEVPATAIGAGGGTSAAVTPADAGAATGDEQAGEAGADNAAADNPAEKTLILPYSGWLETAGWIYIWVVIFVLFTLGVDIDRNMAVFWIVFFIAVWALGLWLQDTKGFTFFGNIFRWFGGLDVQYSRSFGVALSLILLIPFAIMLLYARINDRWRITHNEFEHYSLGRMDDSLGRGAKTIRTSFPDVFELILGLCGTLVVYNATGTRELRRIPHVMFLPLVRRRLNKILERTMVTAAQTEEEEDDEDDG